MLFMFCINVFSQEIDFDVHGRYKRAVKDEKLFDAKLLSDVIDGYPANWITNYVSVEIEVICNGKVIKAVSSGDALSTEQKNILRKADMASDIFINVKYQYKNPAIDHVENNKMNVEMTVVPETEAQYIGGEKEMRNYLRENAINKIPESCYKIVRPFQQQFQQQTQPQFKLQTLIRFTVNEEGEITAAKIVKTSADKEIDKLLLDAINKMPKWKPAKDAKGVNVKQEFEFSVNGGRSGGC